MLFLSAQAVEEIRQGSKTFDMRIQYSTAERLQPGDVIVYMVPHQRQTVEVRLKRVARYTSFAELAVRENKNRSEVPCSNPVIEKEFGVVFLEFEPTRYTNQLIQGQKRTQ
jgi:ASC-1-like (ASCH) protein